MISRKFVYIIACLLLLSLASCSAKTKSSTASNKVVSSQFDSILSASSQSQAIRNVDVKAIAASLSTTDGKVALSLIICKLDNSKVLDELAVKDAQDLFDILTETALQKSQTLESLDDVYDLKDILASEKIYVTIKSNAVSSAAAPQSSVGDWIPKFQKAINAN